MRAGKAVSLLPASWAKTEKEVPAVWFNKNQCLAQASLVGPVILNRHKKKVFPSVCVSFQHVRVNSLFFFPKDTK